MTRPAVVDPRRHPEAAALALLLAVALLVPLLGPAVPAGVYGRGLITAALLALHGLGIVLAYRSDRFLNLAQVQIGAVGGTLFALGVQARPFLRGLEEVCPPCVDARAPAYGLAVANDLLSLVVGIGLALLIAWVFGAAVVPRLTARSRLATTVASVFLVQILVGLRRPLVDALTTEEQRAAGVPAGATGVPLEGSVTWGGARFDVLDLAAVALAAVAAVGLSWWLRRTRSGIALRAAAQRPDRARTLGVSVGRITSQVWVVIGALSAAAALLTVAAVGEGAVSDGLQAGLLVRLLAVALLARLTSVGLTVLAAVAVGVLDEVVRFAAGSPLLVDGGLLLVVGLLLLVQRQDRRRSDDASDDRIAGEEFHAVPAVLRELPEVRRWRRGWRGVTVVAVLGLPWILSPSQTNLTTVATIYAIVGLSLLVLTGWAGAVSLGQFAFAAVGGWIAAVTGVHPLLALPLAAAAGAATALLVGLPALRLRGLHLAVTSLAFAVATSAVLLDPRALGSLLPEAGDRPTILGLDLDDQRVAYYVAVAILLLVLAAVTGLRRSPYGRALIATRDDAATAAALGLHATRLRLTAFAISGAIAAIGGVLFTYQQGGVRPDAFAAELSVLVFVTAVVGGFGSPAAPIAGFAVLALVSVLAPEGTTVGLVTGLAGLGLLVAEPGGVSALTVRVRDGFLRRVARRRRIAVPTLQGAESAADRAPIRPKVRAGGGTEFVPQRYGLDDQWLSPDAPTRDGVRETTDV